MLTHNLFDSSLQPERLPDCRYALSADVVCVREASDVPVIAEVFERAPGIFGFRFQAWVAWRDAGGQVRGHSWHAIDPKETLFTDDIAEAQLGAGSYSAAAGVALGGQWHVVTKG